MKYILNILLLLTLNATAQSYKAEIADFRKKYREEFLSDKDSPLKEADLPYLRFYAVDSLYRVEATAELFTNAPGITIPTYTGKGSDYIRYAKLKFSINGKPFELTIYQDIALSKIEKYKDYLFLPFTDLTNGKETYAGGRYIDFREGDFKGNKLIIDFNKAYNPYCAFGSGYSCPKPPDENNLQVAIVAGEKLFAKKTNH